MLFLLTASAMQFGCNNRQVDVAAKVDNRRTEICEDFVGHQRACYEERYEEYYSSYYDREYGHYDNDEYWAEYERREVARCRGNLSYYEALGGSKCIDSAEKYYVCLSKIDCDDFFYASRECRTERRRVELECDIDLYDYDDW